MIDRETYEMRITAQDRVLAAANRAGWAVDWDDMFWVTFRRRTRQVYVGFDVCGRVHYASHMTGRSGSRRFDGKGKAARVIEHLTTI